VASRAEAEESSDEFTRRQRQLFEEGFSFSGYERDVLALNLGNARFLDISGVSGVDSITDGRGAVFADFDNDGDTDIFLAAMHGTAHLLLRNNVGAANRSLRMTLEGTGSSVDAFGAVVRVKTSAGIQTKIKAGGSGFLSQSDPRPLFGLGEEGKAEWVEVAWPSGQKQRFSAIPSSASVKIKEGETVMRPVVERQLRLPDPLPEAEARWQALKIRKGDRLPPLPVTTLQGRPGRLSALLPPGRRALVNLWATWCIPCAREMPELQRLHAGAGEQGLSVIGVSLDDANTRPRVPEFLARLGITYPIVLADREFASALFAADQATVPLSLLLDEQGKLQEIFSGWSRETSDRLRALQGPGPSQ
jgi:thiol-disulfide isomerase/thioredoxin